MEKTGSSIATIFWECFSAIGGQNNTDVSDYFELRNQKITRDVFFEAVVWAV